MNEDISVCSITIFSFFFLPLRRPQLKIKTTRFRMELEREDFKRELDECYCNDDKDIQKTQDLKLNEQALNSQKNNEIAKLNKVLEKKELELKILRQDYTVRGKRLASGRQRATYHEKKRTDESPSSNKNKNLIANLKELNANIVKRNTEQWEEIKRLNEKNSLLNSFNNELEQRNRTKSNEIQEFNKNIALLKSLNDDLQKGNIEKNKEIKELKRQLQSFSNGLPTTQNISKPKKPRTNN